MVSVCKMESFSIMHHVNIIGYSLAKDFGANSIEAGKFDLAGHTWALCYCPNVIEYDHRYNLKTECITFSVVLVTQPKIPMAVSCELSLLNQDGKSSPEATKSLQKTFTEQGSLSFSKFMETSKFVASEYLKNDSLLVQCSLQVKKPSCSESKKIVVPPPDLNQHLGCLLERKEGADVTFHLNEETFVAHKAVLAARSPVFRAQFFGSMMEIKTDFIKIEEMKPEVFKAMLYFIYTEKLPPGEDVSFEMAQHLLVAADRYGLERLKVICAEMLCAGIDAKTAAATLAFAVQHSCRPLKDFCVDFVASRETLDSVMASDGFEHLMSSCPSVLKEILEKVKKVF